MDAKIQESTVHLSLSLPLSLPRPLPLVPHTYQNMQTSADGKSTARLLQHPNGAPPTAEEVRSQLEESYNVALDRGTHIFHSSSRTLSIPSIRSIAAGGELCRAGALGQGTTHHPRRNEASLRLPPPSSRAYPALAHAVCVCVCVYTSGHLLSVYIYVYLSLCNLSPSSPAPDNSWNPETMETSWSVNRWRSICDRRIS